MTRRKVTTGLIIAYVMIGVTTFGYSYNREYVAETGQYTSPAEVNLLASLLRGVAWPLYWSTVAFEFARPQ